MTAPAADQLLRSLGIQFLERGWLSSNSLVITGDGPSAIVDTGYCSHSQQTLALVQSILDGRPLDRIVNTHLHSDHCGGNSSLQEAYPGVRTLIPPGHWRAVATWDTQELTYQATGQECPRFHADEPLSPGSSLHLGDLNWEVHAAPGHDPHAVVLFQADHRILISADALWENGFGVVFPELEGVEAFKEVAQTIDVIERLEPLLVIPGHGGLFTDVKSAISRARSRLKQFASQPEKHHRYAMKVLIKYRLLEWQSIAEDDLLTWAQRTPYLAASMPTSGAEQRAWLSMLLGDLERSGALEQRQGVIMNR